MYILWYTIIYINILSLRTLKRFGKDLASCHRQQFFDLAWFLWCFCRQTQTHADTAGNNQLLSIDACPCPSTYVNMCNEKVLSSSIHYDSELDFFWASLYIIISLCVLAFFLCLAGACKTPLAWRVGRWWSVFDRVCGHGPKGLLSFFYI